MPELQLALLVEVSKGRFAPDDGIAREVEPVEPASAAQCCRAITPWGLGLLATPQALAAREGGDSVAAGGGQHFFWQAAVCVWLLAKASGSEVSTLFWRNSTC